MSQPASPQPSLSVARILTIVVPAAIVGIAAYLIASRSATVSQDEIAPTILSRMFVSESVPPVGPTAYTDADGDLVADAPDDPSKCIDPPTLVFSFIAAEEESIDEPKWKELLDALAKKTGREVKYVHYTAINDQLAAIKSGEVHIAGSEHGHCADGGPARRIRSHLHVR